MRANDRVALCLERYEGRAGSNDWVYAHGWGYSADVARRTIEDVRSKLPLETARTVLEVGCGSGAVLHALLTPTQSAVGIDLSEGLLRQAGRFGVDLSRIRLLRGDAAALPLGAARFDCVLCYSVFAYFPDLAHAERALDELLRVASPGAVILVGDVPGIAECLRAEWARYGLRADTIRAALRLPALAPVRLALRPLLPLFHRVQRVRGRRESGDEGSLDYLWYSHRFFERWASKRGCEVELLPQRIAGRPVSAYRFDVRLTRPAARRPLSSRDGGVAAGASSSRAGEPGDSP